MGSSCVVCGLDDGRLLRAVALAGGEQITACQNHGWLIERARPKPESIAAAVEACCIPGDRRRPDRDRRAGDRRHVHRSDAPLP